MRYAKLALFAVVVVLVTVLFAPSAQAGVSFSFFYSNLSPHGSWQVSAEYGRVWQPYVYSSGWNPYYDGHWVYSDLGWAWVSDYEWGTIPYHYGTWVLDPYYGWVWVPGYTWAPSWVVFRTGPDYIGWAPVSPGFSVGFSYGYGAPATSSFVFVSAHNFLAPRIRSCYVPRSRTTVIINNTRIVNNLVVENNVVVNRGPDRRFVERASGRSVREVPIERVSRSMPGSRVSRSELRVDPQQARRGLRAAEPVSENRPLPETRQRQSGIERGRGVPATREDATGDAPRAGRRLAGDTAKQRGLPSSVESSGEDSPRATRREKADVEKQRGGARQDTSQRVYREQPRAQNRVQRPASSENVRPERMSPRDTGSVRQPFPRRPDSGHQGSSRKETSQRVYREQPRAQNRGQRPAGPETMRPERMSPRDTGSVRSPNPRRPDTAHQGASGKEEPSRARPSGKTQERKSHGSGKK